MIQTGKKLQSGGFTYEYAFTTPGLLDEWEEVAQKSDGVLVDLGLREDNHALQVRYWHSEAHTYLNYNTGDDPYRVEGKLTEAEVRQFARGLCEGELPNHGDWAEANAVKRFDWEETFPDGYELYGEGSTAVDLGEFKLDDPEADYVEVSHHTFPDGKTFTVITVMPKVLDPSLAEPYFITPGLQTPEDVMADWYASREEVAKANAEYDAKHTS